MGSYAIVKASGRQFWIEENRFYDLNKLPLQPGYFYFESNSTC